MMRLRRWLAGDLERDPDAGELDGHARDDGPAVVLPSNLTVTVQDEDGCVRGRAFNPGEPSIVKLDHGVL